MKIYVDFYFFIFRWKDTGIKLGPEKKILNIVITFCSNSSGCGDSCDTYIKCNAYGSLKISPQIGANFEALYFQLSTNLTITDEPKH